MSSKLPPLPDTSFDGHKEQTTLSLQKTCDHKQIKIISSTELDCPCGVGFIGPNIIDLYNSIKTT